MKYKERCDSAIECPREEELLQRLSFTPCFGVVCCRHQELLESTKDGRGSRGRVYFIVGNEVIKYHRDSIEVSYEHSTY